MPSHLLCKALWSDLFFTSFLLHMQLHRFHKLRILINTIPALLVLIISYLMWTWNLNRIATPTSSEIGL